MDKIIFATNNEHKLNEMRSILKNEYEVLGLKDIRHYQDIPETGITLEQNASIKSHTIHKKYGINCFSDDTGLLVEALNGQPGVWSARYAGDNATYDDNVTKLLAELENEQNRKAAFKTIISLILNGKEYFFEGSIEGVISKSRTGKLGFGYDPVFIPVGYNISFAEMKPELKNEISHRALATKKLVNFLKNSDN